MRQVIIWSLILVVLFVVFIGLAFVGLTYMTPSPEELQKVKQQAAKPKVEVSQEYPQDDSLTDPDSIKKAPTKVSVADSLEKVIDDLKSDLFFNSVTMDSLNQELNKKDGSIAGYSSQVESLEEQVESLKSKNASIKDLAKTYETMKVADIRPILERVDDETIIALYKNMGSRSKKNLLQALSDIRAAKITKKLAGS